MLQPTSWRPRAGIRAIEFPVGVIAFIRRGNAAGRQRRQFAELPDHLLKDIGRTPQVRREALRAFWDLPKEGRHRW
jgi:uncharacterized protein YjiS (DUF1127 family)